MWILLLPTAISLHAQELCSLPPRLMVNMPGRVRSVSTAGNNLRDSASLTATVTTQLANETEFTVLSEPKCIDGLYWYLIRTFDGVSGWTAEGNDGVYWVEPIPFCTPQQRAANMSYLLDATTGEQFFRLADVKYVPERKALLLASQPADATEIVHPALWSYYWFNLETQVITPTQYPDADIVTPELTNKLGITEFVFGSNSRAFNSLHVSPQRDRILYFSYNPPIEPCAHCGSAQMWVAEVDGSNPIEVGTMPMGEAGYIDLQWSSDGIIYLTMVYAGSSYGVIEICEDGACFNRPQDSFPYNYAYPSISPDSEYITFMRMYGGNYSNEKAILFEQKTGKWIELSLPSWSVPAIWSDDGKNVYFIGMINNHKVLASTPLDDLAHADILVDDLAMGYGNAWDVAPDLGLMVSAIDYYGLNIYCMN